jgi:glycosyltransferase involved in cell wall biosynthesis
MRVLLLSQFFRPVIGGEERAVEDLGVELAARGHDVAVATTALEDRPARELVGDVRVYRLRTLLGSVGGLHADPRRRHVPPAPDPLLVRGLEEVFALERPELLHAHNWIAHSALGLRARHRVPLVLTLHDYSLVCATKRLTRGGAPCAGPRSGGCLRCARAHYGSKGAPIVLAGRATAPRLRRHVDMYVPVSRAVADASGLARAGLPHEVVPNFLPRERSGSPDAEVLSSLPTEPFVLFVGDVSADKGANVLLQAHASLPGRPELVLVGRDLVGAARRGVHVLGPQEHATALAAMRRCAVLVVPSVWPEPFGLVALEALSVGCPVVASRSGGLVDIVDHGESGLLVSPGDASGLARAIGRLLKDPGRRVEMGLAAASRAERFRADAVVPRIERIYGSLVDSRARRRRSTA